MSVVALPPAAEPAPPDGSLPPLGTAVGSPGSPGMSVRPPSPLRLGAAAVPTARSRSSNWSNGSRVNVSVEPTYPSWL
jgi:hypothetical protein